MLIPIDFSTRITVENLDTGEKKVFLVPRGTERLVQIPEEMAHDLGQLMPDDIPPLGPSGGREPQLEPDLGPDPASGDQGLAPGSLGGSLGSQDIFGAAEG